MNLRAIHGDIIFEFCDTVSNGGFVNQTSWGLQIVNKIEDVKHARWGKILNLGPDVRILAKIGDYILIQPLMWTTKFTYNGKDLWKTNDEKVLAVTSDKPSSTAY